MNEQDPGHQRRLMLALILSTGLVLLWQAFFAPTPPPPAETPAATTTPADPAAPAAAPAATPSAVPSAAVPGGSARVEPARLPPHRIRTPNLEIDVTNVGARLSSLQIVAPDKYVPRVPARGVFPDPGDVWLPLSITAPGIAGLREDSVWAFDEAASERSGDHWRRVSYRWTSDDGSLELVRRYEPDDRAFGLSTTLEIRNAGAAALTLPGLSLGVHGSAIGDSSGFLGAGGNHVEAVCASSSGTERELVSGVDVREAFEGSARFVAVAEQYFMLALAPRAPEGGALPLVPSCSFDPMREGDVQARLNYGPVTLAPGESHRLDYTVFAGPKDTQFLDAYPHGLEAAIDYGFFAFLCVIIRAMLLFFQGFVNNWGVSIILLTFAIKLILTPLTNASFRSMEKQRMVMPRMQELQKKYENDRMKLAEEQMKLYKEEGINPMGGCLPMLLQMPIYFALYRTIWSSAELYQAEFFGWITDLSVRDPYFILPVLMGATMVVQTRMTPQTVDNPQMKMVQNIMPIMFTAMMLFLPSGLVLYIFVNMLLSIAHQLYIRRKFEAAGAAAKVARG